MHDTSFFASPPPKRQQPIMPANTMAFYSAVFVCGLVEAAYVIWWIHDWTVSFMAASATGLILIPLFMRREFRAVAVMEHEMQLDLHAQMIAGNERIRLMLDKNEQRLLEFQESFIEENRRLRADNELLLAKYMPFAPGVHPRDEKTGKFISTKPKQIGSDRKSRPTLTIDVADTVIVLPSSEPASKIEGLDSE